MLSSSASLEHFCHMMSSLQNALYPCPILLLISCTWSWSLVTICLRKTKLSTSPIYLLSTITSSLLTCLLNITLVFPRCILRPTGLLMQWISWSISYSFEVELAMRTISWENIRWDIMYPPSTLMSLFSQFILLMMTSCRHDVKSFGRDVIPLSAFLF